MSDENKDNENAIENNIVESEEMKIDESQTIDDKDENKDVSVDDVIEVLKQVYDPDMGLDIYFLGLVYDVKVTNNDVLILMTFTSPLCPMAEFMVGEVKSKVSKIEGVQNVQVEITFDPPWTPSEELRGFLGF